MGLGAWALGIGGVYVVVIGVLSASSRLRGLGSIYHNIIDSY